MDQTVTQMSARLNKIELEYNLAVRKRADGVAKAVKALAEISKEDVEMLKGVAPTIAVIASYTEKDLMENLNGEVGLVHQAASELKTYLEHRLSFYEEQL